MFYENTSKQLLSTPPKTPHDTSRHNAPHTPHLTTQRTSHTTPHTSHITAQPDAQMTLNHRTITHAINPPGTGRVEHGPRSLGPPH